MKVASVSAVLPLVLLSVAHTVNADDISVGMITQCNGFGGEYQVTSASCGNCNWGEEATLSGTVNKNSCSDICIVGTAHATMGIGESFEVFRDDGYDCTNFEKDFHIPGELPTVLENLASGHVLVEFFVGGCDGERVGCSKISLTGVPAPVRVAGAIAGIGAAALAGAAIYKHVAAGAAMREAGSSPSSGTEFSKMDDNRIV